MVSCPCYYYLVLSEYILNYSLHSCGFTFTFQQNLTPLCFAPLSYIVDVISALAASSLVP
jgi:hypothetical protein